MGILSKPQRNAIRELVDQTRLDPNDFAWTGSTPTARFEHVPTGACFDMTLEMGEWGLEFRVRTFPGYGMWSGPDDLHRWDVVVGRWIPEWLESVDAHHCAPDLWSQTERETAIPDASTRDDLEEPFTETELLLVASALTEVEALIVAAQPDMRVDERAALSGRFQYLLDAAKRGIRKIDWINIFAGQVFTMTVSGLVDKGLYGTVMAHAGAALNAALNLGAKFLGA